MSGQEKYTNTWMTVDFNVYWLNAPSECVPPQTISDWMTEIYYVYTPNWTAFDKLQSINVWNIGRSDCPEIKNYAGLCYPDGRIDIAMQFCNPGTISHEFGHHVAFANGMGDWADDMGKKMWSFYGQVRGQDFTAATPRDERWAEDFRYFFGANSVRGVLGEGDDYYKGTARHPDTVTGLKTFIKDFHRVLSYWRRVGSITLANATYNPSSGCWMWSRTTWWFFQQWEAFVDGKFFQWQNNKWVEMTV
jgi:hypothetical protein